MRVAAPLFLLAALGTQQVLSYSYGSEFDARAVGGAYNTADELASRGYSDEDLYERDYEADLYERDYEIDEGYFARDAEDVTALFLRELDDVLSARGEHELYYTRDVPNKPKDSKVKKANASHPGAKGSAQFEADAVSIQKELDSIPDSSLSPIYCDRVTENLKWFHKSTAVLKKWSAKLAAAEKSGDAKSIEAAKKQVADWRENTMIYMWAVVANGAPQKSDPLAASRRAVEVKAAKAALAKKVSSSKKDEKKAPVEAKKDAASDKKGKP